MAYKFHPVSSRYWTDERVMLWDDDARLLGLYLMTCQHRLSEGLYRLPKPYIIADLKWSVERLDKPFRQLLRDGFINYDEGVSVILLNNALKYRQPENPNQETAAMKAIEELPANPLVARLIELAEEFAPRFAQRLVERYGKSPTPTPSPNPSPEPMKDNNVGSVEPTTETASKNQPKGEDYTEEFLAFWEEYPRKLDKKGAFKVWKTQIRKGTAVEDLMTATRHYVAAKAGKEMEFIQHPSTFLGPNDRWRDYLDPVTQFQPPEPTRNQPRAFASLQRAMDKARSENQE